MEKKIEKKSHFLTFFLLFLILALGCFLRFFKIGENPPALNWDEVSHGYNAYSVLKTSRDQWGFFLPTIFRVYGDYKLPLYIYLTIPFVFFWGLSSFSVRVVSAIAGSLMVLVTYWLTISLFKKREAGLVAAFLTAVTPWALFLSRVAVEANLGALFFALGFLFIFRNDFLKGFLFWGLSLHSYNSARVLVPTFLLVLLVRSLFRKEIKKFFYAILFLGLISLPIFFQFLNRSFTARFYWTNILDKNAVGLIENLRNSSQLPRFLKRTIYNRPLYFIYQASKNYLSHFSPRFLFKEGGDHYQFSLPNHGLLYWAMAPFMLIGFYYFFKKKYYLLLFWFFAGFFPGAITKDAPHVLRSILVLPLPMVISAVGLVFLIDLIKRKSKFGGRLIIITFVLTVSIWFLTWWRDYWHYYPKLYSWAWQYGYKEVVSYAKEHYSEYDKIIFTKKYGEPHEFVLFYWSWDPKDYQQDSKKIWDYHAYWYWIDAFDKFEFWNDWEVKNKLRNQKSNLKSSAQKLRLLLITSPGNYNEGGNVLKTVNFLDGSPVFEIVHYEN